MRAWARHLARGPADLRVGSAAHAYFERLTCVSKGVNAHIQRFARELHARPGAVVPRSQTTSVKNIDNGVLRLRRAAFWTQRCPAWCVARARTAEYAR